MSITIRPGTIEEAIQIQKQIPELDERHSQSEYTNRLLEVEHVILIALQDKKPVGFKVGYDRFLDGDVFYGWVGGVLDGYRQLGIAKTLLSKMEVWCKLKGYKRIKFKTKNKYREILRFAVNQGFDVVGFEKGDSQKESCVYFQKNL